jgi:hypothetical protein
MANHLASFNRAEAMKLLTVCEKISSNTPLSLPINSAEMLFLHCLIKMKQ